MLHFAAIIMGIIFVMLYHKTQSILPGIILHITWNLIVGLLIVLS
ncbi:CPBP family glutamic-type intramembrane protease [Bacillus wiedmannii]